MARHTGTIINVALILLAVIVLGGMLRMISFPRILPEGFEDASKKDDDTESKADEGEDDDGEKDKKGDKKSDKKGDDKSDKKGDDKKGDDKKGDDKKVDDKKSDKKSDKIDTTGPAVDFDKNMKNFLSENSDNDALMGSLHKDAKALMKNQEQLMNMLQTTGPMLKSSMDMVKSFKGMFGGNA